MKANTEIKVGTIRIKLSDFKPYEKTKTGWKKSKLDISDALKVIKLFKAHKNLKELVDQKNPQFLKGQLSKDQQIQGARITILPDGTKLDKAYSLFAKHLAIHDQDSHDHWDVLFQNKGGTWAYGYSLQKRKLHKQNKFKKVEKFAKVYPKLKQNVTKALVNVQDHLAVPMYTLLTTYMRVGNEVYYKANGHKGLTTLTKQDVTIKGDTVSFNYLAKDGVPRLIVKKFPASYVKRLKQQLKPLKKTGFVFQSCKSSHPLREQEFKKAFKAYCGQEFFPHIVRSHYATQQVKDFLKHNKKASKDEVNKLFLSIAAQLGHKKFVKKENKWENNYSVTVSHYIQPELVERVKRITK